MHGCRLVGIGILDFLIGLSSVSRFPFVLVLCVLGTCKEGSFGYINLRFSVVFLGNCLLIGGQV